MNAERNTSPQEQSGRARGEVGAKRAQPQVAQRLLCQSAKAQAGTSCPKLPDIALNPNVNDLLLHPNDIGLFDNRQQDDINLLERIKDNHKSLLNKIHNNNNNNNPNNNRLTSSIDKRYLKQCEFYNEKKYDASALSSSSSSQIDVSTRGTTVIRVI
jgi:hypothetical protein